MVTELDNGRFAKDCPQCGVQQTYLRKNYAVESKVLGKRCKACTNNDPENNAHKGYSKGGMTKCGASNPPMQKGKAKK